MRDERGAKVIHAVCFPSATEKRGHECIERWISKGYKPVVMFDDPKDFLPDAFYDEPLRPVFMVSPKPFPGYYKVINAIVTKAFDSGADLVTCIGDDMDPPEQGAQVAAQAYFDAFPDGFGILQPTGDPQGMDKSGKPASARICGSPVIGRKWHERAYGGKGAFCDEYTSFYGDEELHEMALQFGVLLNASEFSHFHRHWSFGHMERQEYHHIAQRNWDRDYETFNRRKEAGFPCKMLT